MVFDCDEQIGGYKVINFCLLSETSDWPVVLNDVTSNQIVLTREVNSICGMLVPNSIRVREKPSTTKSGQLWDISISYEFAVQNSALEQLLDQYANRPGVCEVEKNYPQKKLYGSDKFPLLMTYELINGEKPEDGSKTVITIKGKVPHRAVHIAT